MARKTRKKSQPSSNGPTTVGAVLEQSPIAQLVANHETEESLPEQDGEEAVAMYKEQIRRAAEADDKPSPAKATAEASKAEQPAPEAASDKPVRQQKSWGETVRGWSSHGETGVKHVTTTSPDMVGVSFPKDKPRTAEEKRDMDEAGLKFFAEAKAWLKPNRDGAFDETQDIAKKFAERRREQVEVGVER